MKNIILGFIPEQYKQDEEVLRKANLLVIVCFLTSIFSSFYLTSSLYFNMPHAVYAMLFNVVGFIVLPFLFRFKIVNMLWASNLYVFIGAIGVGMVTFYTGGLKSSILPWFAVLPITSLMLTGKRSGWFWTIVSYLAVSVVGFFAFKQYGFPDESKPIMIEVFNTTNLNGLVLLTFLITMVFENTKNTALKRLDEKNNLLAKEMQKSEDLLLNILPYEVSQELKAKGSADAKLINEVTVLFTDFKGFTKLSEQLSPQDLVAEINHCFSAFDNIMQKHGVEKIKTIGDAYMAAGGLPTPNGTHAMDVVNAAVEIQQFMASHKQEKDAEGKLAFEIRIGVHTGPVVAGIVGIKKFQYDIWGDTVNTASRMESSGEAGKVNISGTTYALVKNAFACTYRGEIDAKNKGNMKMYFVN